MEDLWNGERYHSNSKLQETLARDFILIFQKYLPVFSPNSKFLDVGCGSGSITNTLSHYFPKINTIGIDSSPSMVCFAKEKFKSSNLTFNVDDAEALKTIKDQQIDVITSFSCLLWVQNLKNAFNAMYRVLKPGGWIALQFPAEDYLPCAIDVAYARILNEEPWKPYLAANNRKVEWNNVDLRTIQNQLLEIGFEIKKIDFAYWNYQFKDRKSFTNCLEAGLQQLKVLPKDLHGACVERIIELYLEITADRQPHDGSCIYECNGLQIIGKK